MRKRVLITLLFSLLFLIPIWCQPTNGDLADALASLGLSKTWATIIVLSVATVIGKLWPQKWTDPLNVVIKIMKVVMALLDWVNDKVNRGSVDEKEHDKVVKDFCSFKGQINRAWKFAGMIILFVGFTSVVSAQSPWTGFFYSVKDNPALKIDNNKALSVNNTTHLVRFDMNVGGVGYLYNKVEKQLELTSFLKVGMGLSYSFYKVEEGKEPYNYLSLSGFLFLPIPETGQKSSIAVAISAFNMFGLNLSPQIGLNFEPSLINSDYFPIAPLVGLKYNFD